MHVTGWPIRRLDNGTIDYDFYRAEAGRRRAEAIQAFYPAIGRALVEQLRRLVTPRRILKTNSKQPPSVQTTSAETCSRPKDLSV